MPGLGQYRCFFLPESTDLLKMPTTCPPASTARAQMHAHQHPLAPAHQPPLCMPTNIHCACTCACPPTSTVRAHVHAHQHPLRMPTNIHCACTSIVDSAMTTNSNCPTTQSSIGLCLPLLLHWFHCFHCFGLCLLYCLYHVGLCLLLPLHCSARIFLELEEILITEVEQILMPGFRCPH